MTRTQAGVVVLVLAATSAAAQQAPPTPTVTAEVQIIQRRFQFQVLEGVIENAVRLGAQEFAARVQGVAPSLGMLFMGMPKARGFPLEHWGVVFDVEIPQVRESYVVLNEMQRPNLTAVPQTGTQVVNNSGKVSATRGVVADDPMAKPPVTGDAYLAANQLYRETVKSKLVDAMLDYSKALDIGPDEWLSVVARGEDDPIRTTMFKDSKILILRIKGSDLALFYSGKIARDDARKLVIESQF